MSHIAENLAQVRAQIQAARSRFNRKDDVQLLAVSKTKPVALLLEAWQSGQRHFGENYLQEALDKIAALPDKGIIWHFIGPVQSNKTTPLAENFDWIHCVDRARIARRLNDARSDSQPALNICLQVNISGESSKSGVSIDELPALAAEVSRYPKLNLRGLMAIPASSHIFEEQQYAFSQLACALQALQQDHPSLPLDTLSMGMSNDLDAAISQGATFVRIGTAIFGARDYSTKNPLRNPT